VDEESLNELASIKIPAEELEEIGKLINTPQLAFLPTWVWEKMGAYSDGNIDMGDIAHSLTISANRSLIHSCMSIIIPEEKKHKHLLDEIKGLLPTDDLENLPGLIKVKIDELTYYIANKLKNAGLGAFQVKFEKLGISNEQCDEFCDVLESIHNELSHETAKDLTLALLRENSFQRIISNAEFYKHGANKLSEYVAFSTMTFEQIRSTAEKQKAFKNLEEGTETHYKFDIRHDIVEENRKVSLTYSDYDDENTVYGFIQFPLKITSTKGERVRFDLTYSISSQLTTQWPAEWDSPSPTKGLGAYGDWNQDESGRLYTSVHVIIPLRKPTKGVSKNIEIKVDAINPLTNEVLGSYNCQWGDIQESSDRIRYNWADSIRTEWVDEHPVGPQIRASSLLDKVDAGNSFAVIAPRRFGKSTLAKYIEERSQKLGVLACTVTCTEFVSDSGAVNYDAIWRTISTNIGKAIGAQISYDQQFTFPNEDDFDFARIQAKKSGYKNITLIFDEAQLLFRNAAAGSRFKGLLETNWSQDTSSKTPICFGFLGLPSLRERGGRDLMGLLRPIEKMEFDEENLSKLLKKPVLCSIRTKPTLPPVLHAA
jgi:hypothetical protein